MTAALGFTAFQLAWSGCWATLHVRIRKSRRYAHERAATGRLDNLYRRLNPLMFVVQLGLSIACFWSDGAGLLQLHHSLPLRFLGATLLSAALGLTLAALRHLGDNYSPCYDSHLPRRLVTSGPYAWLRHPMYLAKMLAGAGTLLLSGSLWFVPSTVYLFWATWRALRLEERVLAAELSGYEEYASRTRALIPWVGSSMSTRR